MAFDGHICCWDIYGYSMVIKAAVWYFLIMSAVVLGLHVDCTIRAVRYTCVMGLAYLFRGIFQ